MAAIGQRRPAANRNANGGLTAPPQAAKGHSTGLNANRVPPARAGLGGAQKVPGQTRGGTQPVAGQPAAQAAPQQPLMPWDLAAANDEAGAQKRLGNTLTGLDSGWMRTQQEYGLEGQWADAASNPYSRSALLQRSYDNAKRGSLNSAGQNLYSGSYINAQNSNTHQFNLGRDELQRSYDQANAGYIGERQGAQDQFNEALSGAAWDRVNAGLNSELEPAPLSAPGSTKKSQPKKPQQKKQPPKAVSNNVKLTAPIRGGTRKVR